MLVDGVLMLIIMGNLIIKGSIVIVLRSFEFGFLILFLN